MLPGISSTEDGQSAPATSMSFKKKHATATNNTSSSKNLYSTRGLEKFTSVLSDLEAKKEKILARIGSDVAMVRFKYTTSQDFIPIVIKMRDDSRKQSNAKPEPAPSQPIPKEPVSSSPAPTAPPPPSPTSPQSPAPAALQSTSALPEVEKKVKKSVTWDDGGKKGGELWRWRPSYYTLVLVLLLLVCLTVSGRVFAICCTAVWWYLLPLLKGSVHGSEITKRWTSKKECDYKFGDKKLSTITAGGSSFKKVGTGVCRN